MCRAPSTNGHGLQVAGCTGIEKVVKAEGGWLHGNNPMLAIAQAWESGELYMYNQLAEQPLPASVSPRPERMQDEIRLC